MMETNSYYNDYGSNVYALVLDASNAFDRVNYCKLFRVLLKRQVSSLVLRQNKQNTRSSCGGNYCQILYEYSAHVAGGRGQREDI